MEPLLTSDEVAAYLRVDVVTIRRLVNRGELPAYRIRGEYRFRRQELEEYLQRQRVPGKDEEPTDTLGALALFVRKLFGGDKPALNAGMVSSGFERFDSGARNALQCAQDEARRLRHHYIGTEHLLLGLVREGEGTAAQVLKGLGVELEAVRGKVEFIIGHGEHEGEGEVPLTRRAKKVIELAVDEALRLDHQYLGTEHLLLGMIREGDGIGAQVLRELGVDLRAARAQTIELLDAQPTPEPPSSAEEKQAQ
ncbi:MAG TPA: Clp protease N-terminal domain-containing protein [Ktedonobacterales bacterium]